MNAQEWRRQEQDPYKALVGEVRDTRRSLKSIANGILTNAGLVVEEGLLRVRNALRVEGELVVTGDTRIEGTLSLPEGIIDNDALANPVMPDTFWERADGWATTSDHAPKVTETISTPEGFTKCVVIADAWATAQNSSASTSVLYIRPTINGLNGPSTYVSGISPGSSGSGQSSDSRLVTGLSDGATFTVQTEVRSGSAWAADESNVAIISGTLLWFR